MLWINERRLKSSLGEVIVVSDLGSNQIILARTEFSDPSEIAESSCKSAASSRINLDGNEREVLVIDDHTSFSNLNVCKSITQASSVSCIKTGFSFIHGKEYVTESNSKSHVSSCLHSPASGRNNQHQENNDKSSQSEAEKEERSISNDIQQTRDDEHHSVVGSGALGYTAHLLSQLSDSKCLPAMSSSQVSSVLSALETSDKSVQTLECVIFKKPIKPSVNSDIQSVRSQSPEFVKIEEGICEIPKSTSSKSPSVESRRFKELNSSDKQLSVFQCAECNFLSLKENAIEEHYAEVHLLDSSIIMNRKQINCIGCNNTFYSKHSLEVHLLEDHGVSESEIEQLISAVSDTEKDDLDETVITPLIVYDKSEEPLTKKKKFKRENEEKAVEKTESQANEGGPIANSVHKKRGRSKDAQSLRLVRSKFKSEIILGNDLAYRCGLDACAVRLQSESKMEYHKLCHSGKSDVAFQCPECKIPVALWRNLTWHLWKMHEIDMELYSCTECGYKTNSHSKLVNLHSRIHGDERPFLCDLCGKGFKTTKQLRNHKAIHKNRNSDANEESNRTLSCNICGRTVSDARNLRHHTENVHNKRKPYLCSFCDYATASPSSLRMHSRQHTGEKPFSCDECDYTTSDHNSLRRHKMRHSGDKPYQCPHCPYACIQSTTYKVHLKNKHPGMDEGLMFSCPACPFRTVKKENYMTHTAEHVLNENVNSDKVVQLRKILDGHLTSPNIKSLMNTSNEISTNNVSHITPTLLIENNAELQNLVKHVSSSIIPANQLETVDSISSVNLHRNTTLIAFGLKNDVTLAQATAALPVAGLAHGEIIISDHIALEDSESESMNGELIVPERQNDR